MAIYHQFHGSAVGGRQSINHWQDACHDMFAGKRPPQINNVDWGFGDHELPEHVFEFL